MLMAAMSPAAFIRISEDDTGAETSEERMLKASTEEIRKKIPVDEDGHRKPLGTIWFYIDQYLIEPLATTFRFFHLVLIFVPVIITVPIIWIGSRQKHRDDERSGTIWWYGFLVSSMERAGPAFIKLGQWAASRRDIFPSEMCHVMSTLHSNAPAHSIRHTRKTLERAFGHKHLDEIFDEFDETPLGVGAIAQVYKARLKPDLVIKDDDEFEKTTFRQNIRESVDALAKSSPQRLPSSYVAIKVLHPHVERIVRRDIKIMGVFAAILNAVPTFEWLSFPDEVVQFGEMMRLQLDLRIEAANLVIFRKNFKNRTTVTFPIPYTDFSTREVLVEEFAQGIPLGSFLEDGGGIFQSEIADEGLDAFLHMLLIDNFTHADLHPGNIMVRFYKPKPPRVVPKLAWTVKIDDPETDADDVTEEVLSRLRPHRHKPEQWNAQLNQIDAEGYRPQLIFIDTGLVTELNDVNRENFLDLFKSIAEFDGYKAGHLMMDRCRQPDAVINRELFALKMQHLVLGVKSRTFALGNVDIGGILNQVLGMVRDHHVRLEGDFVNVVISIFLLEGIGRTLDPNLDLFKSALPILRQLGAKGGASMLGTPNLALIKVWIALEGRMLLQATVEDVENCVKYDLLSPNV